MSRYDACPRSSSQWCTRCSKKFPFGLGLKCFGRFLKLQIRPSSSAGRRAVLRPGSSGWSSVGRFSRGQRRRASQASAQSRAMTAAAGSTATTSPTPEPALTGASR